jgi:hypothetical protein
VFGSLHRQAGKSLVEQGVGRFVLRAGALGVVFAAQARGFNSRDQAGAHLGAQILFGARLAAAEHLHDGVVHVFGRDRLHRLALQVTARVAGRHAFEIAG